MGFSHKKLLMNDPFEYIDEYNFGDVEDFIPFEEYNGLQEEELHEFFVKRVCEFANLKNNDYDFVFNVFNNVDDIWYDSFDGIVLDNNLEGLLYLIEYTLNFKNEAGGEENVNYIQLQDDLEQIMIHEL